MEEGGSSPSPAAQQAEQAPGAAAAAAAVVPPQERPPAVHDFRRIALGPRGFKVRHKRKLEEYQAQAAAEEAAMDTAEGASGQGQAQGLEQEQLQPAVGEEDAAADMEAAAAQPATKRQRLNAQGAHKVSGKAWKAPGVKASARRGPTPASPWERKMAAKAQRRAFQEQRDAAIEARRQKLRRAREQRMEAKQRRADNQKKSQVVQMISNPATLKRMMKDKKQKKKLVVVDTVKV